MFFRHFHITDEGDHLHAKFRKLGDLPGRSFDEITMHVCLDPEEVIYLDDGNRVYRWAKLGYEITILCDHTDRCVKIMHERSKLFPDLDS
jgi:hypothetical protein